MGTELQDLMQLPSLRFADNDSTGDIDVANDDIKYTSLKDILPNSPSADVLLAYEGSNFNSSHICIRNQLLKQAASAYVQSAAVLATRNQNWFEGIWQRFVSRSAFHSRWRLYVVNPLRLFFSYIQKKARWFLVYMANGIRHWNANCITG